MNSGLNKLPYRFVIVWLSAPWLLIAHASRTSADEPKLPAWAAWQQVSPVEWPDKFHGKVVDENGTTFIGADVKLQVKAQLFVTGGIAEIVVYESAPRKTDDSGRYEFETDEIPVLSHRPLLVRVIASSPGYAPQYNAGGAGPLEKRPESKIRTIKLPQERVYKGQCLNPDDESATEAVLDAYAGSSLSGSWAERVFRVDDQGRFRFLGPKNLKGCWVYSPHGAPRVVNAKTIRNSSVPIALESGTSVEGVLLDQQGQPSSNAIILAVSSANDAAAGAYSTPFRVTARTDSQGRFRFDVPLKGEYRIVSTPAAQSGYGRNDVVEISNDLPPAIVPLWQTFGDDESTHLTLRAVDTETIRGTVAFENGSPADHVWMRVYQMPDGNGPGLLLGNAFTDENGHYQIDVPTGIERLLMQVDVFRKRDGKSYEATEKTSRERYFRLDRVDSDQTVDYVYRPQ